MRRRARPIWTVEYPTAYRDDFGFDEGPRAIPVIAGGRIFTHGADGMLQALDFASGRKLWAVDTRRDFSVAKGYFGAASSPLVDGDRVLLNVGGRNAGIVAFDAATGKTVWTATSDEASYSSPVMADIAGQRTAVFFTRAGLVALDPASGTVRYQHRWRARMAASVNAATPLVINRSDFPVGELQHGRRRCCKSPRARSSQCGRATSRSRITTRRASIVTAISTASKDGRNLVRACAAWSSQPGR